VKIREEPNSIQTSTDPSLQPL